MKHRFRFLGEQKDPETWRIFGDEWHHLVKVLRLAVHDEVEVTDGQGQWIIGVLESISSKEAQVRVLNHGFENPQTFRLTLGIACLKPQVFDELLPSLIELGVDHIGVFGQRHTDRKWLSEKVRDRWQRLLIGALKQCKRSWLPSLTVYDNIESMLSEVEVSKFDGLYLDPHATHSLYQSQTRGDTQGTFLIVGSEKGLDEEEIKILDQNHFQGAFLGRHVLRAYTACLAGASILSAKRDVHF